MGLGYRTPEEQQQAELEQQRLEEQRRLEEARRREEEQAALEEERRQREQSGPPTEPCSMPTDPPFPRGSFLGAAWPLFPPTTTPGLFDPVATMDAPTPEQPSTPVVAAPDPLGTVEVKDDNPLTTERQAELDQKARDLKGQINAITLQQGSAKELAEVVRGIRNPAEAEYVLAAYNAMYTKEGDPPLTIDQLIQQAGSQFDKAYQSGTGNEDLRGLFEKRLRGDTVSAAEEAFRASTNGSGVGVNADTTEVGTHTVYPDDAKVMVDAFRDLTPKQRQELLATHPYYRGWLDRATRVLGEKEQRDVSVMLDAETQRRDAYAQVRDDEVQERVEALRRERAALGLSTEPTEEDLARIRQEVDQLDASTVSEKAEKLADQRANVAMDVSDLTTGASRERANEILDKAAKDPQYRDLLIERYGKTRPGEAPLGPDGQPLTGLELLERDLADKANQRTWSDVAADVWKDPLSILWRPASQLLGSAPVDDALKDDVASVRSRLEVLRTQQRTEQTRERIAKLTGDANLDGATLDALVGKVGTDPKVKAALDALGVTREDLVVARDATERAETERKAAEFTRGVKDNDPNVLADALDDPKARTERASLEKRRKAAEAGGKQDELGAIDAELLRLDQARARRRELFEAAMKRQTGKDSASFLDANVKHGRVRQIADDAIRNGYVADEDQVYVAAKTGKPGRMASALKGKTPEEVRALDARVAEKYGDADFDASLDLQRETQDREGRSGPVTLDRLIGKMDTGSEVTRSALQVMTKGDPEAVYDPKNPPADPKARAAAARKRLEMETERDEVAYRLQRTPGVLQSLEDGFEDFAKFKGTGAAADEKYQELEAWRRENAERLATSDDPTLWEEYQRRRAIVTGNLKDNEAYNGAATENVLTALQIAGSVALTVATAGGATPVTLLMMQTALALGKVGVEQVMKDGGLSEKDLTRKLGTAVVEAFVSASLGTGLQSLKTSTNPTVVKIATAVDDYGMDALKANSAELLVGDRWKKDPKLAALAKSLGESGGELVKKLLGQYAASKVQDPVSKTLVKKATERTTDYALQRKAPTLADVIADGTGVLATKSPTPAPAA